MTIAKVECFRIRWADDGQLGSDSAWVRIHDDSGATGLGEASPMQGGVVALTIIANDMRPMLEGADPLDSAVLQERLFHHLVKLGPDGGLAAALAAVDIALWDLKGKLLGQPIYQLLGGAWRAELPFYASIGGNARRSVDEVCRVVEKRLEDGPALVKIRLDSDRTRRDVDIPGDIAKARAVRRLVGDDFPLAFDANNGYSPGGAIRVGRALEELGFVWFEEPVQHYHVRLTGEVAQRLDIPVSAGEQTYTLQGLAELVAAGVRVLQPDIIKMGGFTGFQQAQALAHAHGVDLLPHQTQPTIGHTAALHFAAAQLHGHLPCEVNETSTRQHAVFKDMLVPENGLYRLSRRPGLGLTVDEDELARRMRRFERG